MSIKLLGSNHKKFKTQNLSLFLIKLEIVGYNIGQHNIYYFIIFIEKAQ